MNNILKICIILFAALGISQVTFAGSNCDKMKSYKAKMEKTYKSLDLSDEQKQSIKTIKEKYRSELKELYMQHKGYREKMRALVKSDPVDQTKLNDLIKERQDMVAAKIKLKVKKWSAINKILTPEQKEKMGKMRQLMEDKKSKMMVELNQS